MQVTENDNALDFKRCSLPTWSFNAMLIPEEMDFVYSMYNRFDNTLSDQLSESERLQAMCRTISNRSPPSAWYDACQQYYESLSANQKSALEAYTHSGDEIVNTFLRQGPQAAIDLMRNGKLAFMPLMRILLHNTPATQLAASDQDLGPTQEQTISNLLAHENDAMFVARLTDVALATLIAQVVQVLLSIFQDVPKVQRGFLLFRGVVGNAFHLDDIVTNADFMSCSNDPRMAYNFAQRGDRPYVWRISVLAGAKCLPLFDSLHAEESEVLFGPGAKFRQTRCHRALSEDEEPFQLCDVTAGTAGDEFVFNPELYVNRASWPDAGYDDVTLAIEFEQDFGSDSDVEEDSEYYSAGGSDSENE